MPRVEETTFELIADDGERLFARQWQPSRPSHLESQESPALETRPIIADVGLIHGLGEHSGRYTYVAHRLADAGFRVTSFDHRGHGRSPGKRGHAPSFQRMLRDIDHLLEHHRAARLRFLYGHSLGGTLALSYALQQRASLAGLVVSSPLLLPTESPPCWKSMAARALSVVWPSLTFRTNLPPEGLSRNPDAVRAYREDQLVHDRVSARLSTQMFDAGRRVLEQARQLSLSLLLLHGGDDPITSCDASRVFSERAGSRCEFWQSNDGLHELHWEVDRDQAISKIVDWLQRHV